MTESIAMMKKGNATEGRGHILFNLALGHRRIILGQSKHYLLHLFVILS